VGAAASGAARTRATSPGFQVQQGFRLARPALPLNLAAIPEPFGEARTRTIDGKQAVVLTRFVSNVVEDLAFDRESGLLVRRSITSGSAGGLDSGAR
jgi:hypothetical protein